MLDALVVAEVALALILLVGAALTGWNLSRLLAVDVGYEPANLIRLQLGLSDERYADAERRAITVREIVARVASTPGVVAAGATMLHPIPGTRSNVGTTIGLEGEIDPTAPPAVVNRRLATPGYLEAIGLPLERGRTIEARDDARAQPVVVISRATARRFWPGRDPVGERLRVGSAQDPEARWHTVVGVVGDLLEPYAEMGETIYQPYAQATASLPAGSWITTSVALLVRTEGRLPELVARVRMAAREVDPELPLYDVATVESLLAEPLSDQRLGATLFAAFGAFGLLLAALGIYGMVSYAVTRRLPEFGLRLALGAVPTDLKRSVLLATAWRVGLGLLVGAGIALLVGPALGDALSEIGGSDPLVVAASAAVLLAAGLLAAWAPARRAMRADPASSLRAE